MSDEQLPPPGPPLEPRFDKTPYPVTGPTQPRPTQPVPVWQQPAMQTKQATPAGGLGTATIVVAGLMLAVQAGSSLTAWSAGRTYADAGRAQRDVLDVGLTAYDLISMASLPVYLAAYIVTCLWLGKVRNNAETLAPDIPQQRSKVWVWLGWWVPFVSLWFPYQVVRDVDLAGNRGRLSTTPLGAWWVSWLVWAVFSRIASRMLPNTGVPSPDAASALGFLETVAGIAMAIGFVQWFRIVRSINRRQEELLDTQTGLPR
jgi:hypothetical protein